MRHIAPLYADDGTLLIAPLPRIRVICLSRGATTTLTGIPAEAAVSTSTEMRATVPVPPLKPGWWREELAAAAAAAREKEIAE